MKRKLSDREKLIRKFKKFLYDNDALEEWTKGVKKGFFGTTARDVYKQNPLSWINSFSWDGNPRANGDAWVELSVKWINMV